jgi:hypothetical protein
MDVLLRHERQRPHPRRGLRRPQRHQEELRRREVQDLDDVQQRDEHVVRLHVAVDDANLVRRVQPAGDPVRVLQRPQRVQPPLHQALGQRLARQQLHHQEEEALGRLIGVQDPNFSCFRPYSTSASARNREALCAFSRSSGCMIFTAHEACR